MKYLGYLNINIIFYRVYKRRASMSSLRFNHRFNIIMIRQVCGSNDTMLARVVIMRCASQINLSNCTHEIGIYRWQKIGDYHLFNIANILKPTMKDIYKYLYAFFSFFFNNNRIVANAHAHRITFFLFPFHRRNRQRRPDQRNWKGAPQKRTNRRV